MWTDTVNTASRMCSRGKRGQAQVSEPTYKLVHKYARRERWKFADQGVSFIKGKGDMHTWLLSAVSEAEQTKYERTRPKRRKHREDKDGDEVSDEVACRAACDAPC